MNSNIPSRDSGSFLGIDLVSFAFQQSSDFDDKKALYIDAVHPSHSLSSCQLRVLVRKLIAGLKVFGLQKGDRVVVHLFNNVIYPALFFAIVGAGGIYIGSNPANRLFELEHLFRLVEPTVIVTSQNLLSNVLEAATASEISSDCVSCIDIADLDIIRHAKHFSSQIDSHILHGPSPRKATPHSFEDLLKHGESDWLTISDEETAKATPAAFFTTSGTAGFPKAAIHSHYSLISQHLSVRQRVPYEVVRLMSMPFFHLFGTLFGHIFPIRYGEPVYIIPRFHLEEFVNAIHEYQITDAFMSPQMLFAINGYKPTPPLKTLLQSVRFVLCGGENLSAAPQREFCGHLSSEAVVSQVWGMTEFGAMTLFLWPEQDSSGSVGRCLVGSEIKLVDGEGNIICSDSQAGEAYVRTPNAMQGYWKSSSEQPSIIDENGWLYTGDVLSIEHGKYYIRGRAKELIKVKGWQVAPAEIETVLRKHEQIADVAVMGVLREDGLTEVPRCFVVRDQAAQELTAKDIYDFARARLASYKALDGGVVFVDSIPRTAIGKIQRFKLKDLDPKDDKPATAVSSINGVKKRKSIEARR